MQYFNALSVQVHELAANIPAFLSRLLESGMYQSLFSTLLQLGAAPGPASDVCGYFESDLLVEDIQNLLRLVIVRHVDQTQADWELVLDMLFLAAAMTDQHQQQAGHLRSSLCLMVEEALHQLQSKCSDLRLYRPSHFLNIEDCALYSDHQHGPVPRKRSDRVGSNLAERFRKLLHSVSTVCPASSSPSSRRRSASPPPSTTCRWSWRRTCPARRRATTW